MRYSSKSILLACAALVGIVLSGPAAAVTSWYGPYTVIDYYWRSDTTVWFRVVDRNGQDAEPPNNCFNGATTIALNVTKTPSPRSYQLVMVSHAMDRGIRIQLNDDAQTSPPGPEGCEANRPLVANIRLLD